MTEKNRPPLIPGEQLYRYSSRSPVFYVPSMIVGFLNYIVRIHKLPISQVIKEHLEERASFFLIAATGLGKTLTVPLWLLFRHMHGRDMRPPLAPGEARIAALSPRVWVVEPTIAICQGLEEKLNDDWRVWCENSGIESATPLFGCKTKINNMNTDAPIVFLTTGMFAIYARKGMFKAGRDIILIDEAHRTLEVDESVELAIGICRAYEIDLNYMSATVDASDLEDALGVRVIHTKGQRQPLWRHSTQAPMEQCIVELVRKVLVEQDQMSDFFPQPDPNVPDAETINASVRETERAKGMLVMVNSYAGERSEAARITRLLRKEFPPHAFEIGLIASEVLRDRKKKKAYEQMLKRWESEKKKYVLIATSVVEMGVTLPDLDYVVTPDCDFEDNPLSVNSLIQRIGRVGRQRPGIAYITQEVGASYSSLDDAALNASGALAPERIRFPMRTGRLTGLAYQTLAWKWSALHDAAQLKRGLDLPSFDAEHGEELFDRYSKERARLVALDIGSDNPPGLTEEGVLLERWVGRAELGAALNAQRAYQKNAVSGIFSGLMSCAFSIVPEDAICRMLAVEPERVKEVTSELYRITEFILNQILLRNYTSACLQQDVANEIIEYLAITDGQWNACMRFLAAFVEACDVFERVNVNPASREKTNLLYNVRKWRRTIVQFLASPFE